MENETPLQTESIRPRGKKTKTEKSDTPQHQAHELQQYLPAECIMELRADWQAPLRYRGRTLHVWHIQAGCPNTLVGKATRIRKAETLDKKSVMVCDVSFESQVPVNARLRVMYYQIIGQAEVANASD